jgi:DNA-binding transcriptional LysR family regulator
VAREGSFGAAAIRLGYTQSAVSQQIATLERAVGERLIDRPGGPRRVSLTEAGNVLLRHAERLVAGMEAAWADVRAVTMGEAGELRVGTYQSAGARILPDVMREFVAERPGVEVLLTESGSDQELLDLLERGELDLTFTVLPMPPGPFEAVELLRDPYVLMVRADSPLAMQEREVSLRDLAGVPMMGFRHCISGEHMEELVRSRGIDLNVVFRSDDNGTVQGLVGAGMAVALVPLLAVETADERVMLLRLAEELPDRRIALAWHRDRARSSVARAFLESTQRVCDGILLAAPA